MWCDNKLLASINDCDLKKTQSIIYNALIAEPDIYEKISKDINTVIERDPACITYYQPILFFKGFQSLQVYRAANHYWKIGNIATAFYLQSRASQVFDIDIHRIPARPGEPTHDHFDIRFLFESSPNIPLPGNHESHAVRWFPLDQVQVMNHTASCHRMVIKTRQLRDQSAF